MKGDIIWRRICFNASIQAFFPNLNNDRGNHDFCNGLPDPIYPNCYPYDSWDLLSKKSQTTYSHHDMDDDLGCVAYFTN
jgi:hypothetical protein